MEFMLNSQPHHHKHHDINMNDREAAQNRKLTMDEICTGDLIFFHGDDPESKLIEIGTNSLWSHVATTVWLLPTTVTALRNFMTYIPTWRLVVDMLFAQLRKTTKNFTQLETSTPSPDATVIGDARSADGGGGVNDRDRDSLVYHIISITVICCMLNNNKHIQNALKREVSVENVSPVGERRKDLYIWESTTDSVIACVLTNQTKQGIKLSKLVDRGAGYERAMGVRHLATRGIIDNSSTKHRKLHHRTVLLTLFANMCVNAGKDYEDNYMEMAHAWAFGGFCCLPPSSFPSAADYNAETHNSGYTSPSESYAYTADGSLVHTHGGADSGCAIDCGLINCIRSIFFCCPSASAIQYHGTAEFKTLYCSELCTQLLYDYAVVKNIAHLHFAPWSDDNGVLLTNSPRCWETVGSASTTCNMSQYLGDYPSSMTETPRGPIVSDTYSHVSSSTFTASQSKLIELDRSNLTRNQSHKPNHSPMERDNSLASRAKPRPFSEISIAASDNPDASMVHRYSVAADATTNSSDPLMHPKQNSTGVSLSTQVSKKRLHDGQAFIFWTYARQSSMNVVNTSDGIDTYLKQNKGNVDWGRLKVNPFTIQVSQNDSQIYYTESLLRVCVAEVLKLLVAQAPELPDQGTTNTVSGEMERVFYGRTAVTPKYLAQGASQDLCLSYDVGALKIYNTSFLADLLS